MILTLLAHGGRPLGPHDLSTAWSFEPAVLVALALLPAVYFYGALRVWQRAGAGRGVTWSKVACMLGATLGLAVALISPLDALSGALFSAHMVQHTILMFAVAPQLVLSDFPLAVLWALPRAWARAVGRGLRSHPTVFVLRRHLTGPAAAWFLFALALWAWHAPALYQAALEHEAVHALEHGIFLATSILFWWVVLRHTSDSARYVTIIPFLFTTLLQTGVLGALMMFSAQPWYSFYAIVDPTWGLTPLQDQQLAGIIMWLPGGAIYTLLIVGYFAAWLQSFERRDAR